MKEPTTKKLIFRKARKLILKLVVLAVLLSATGVVHATTGYFWGYLSNGDTVWLWCGQGGNYWTRCDTGSCLRAKVAPAMHAIRRFARKPPITTVTFWQTSDSAVI